MCFSIHSGHIRHDLRAAIFTKKNVQWETYWLFQVWIVSWTELTLIINSFNISPECALGMSYFILNLETGCWHCEISCDEWCSVAMRKCEVWSYRLLHCLKELRINECHLKIMTKSMFWCTLYMQSDKNIKQEYFYTDISCLGGVFAKNTSR